MNQFWGYTFGSVVLLFCTALVIVSVFIAIFAKKIWGPEDEEKAA